MSNEGKSAMIQTSESDAERKIITILKILSQSSESLGSVTIARKLEEEGIFLSERAVRYHLKIADERGYTQPLGRDGRQITAKGLEELRVAMAPYNLSFIQEKLELLAFRTTFNPKTRSGLIPINTSLFKKEDFSRALKSMKTAFKAGLCVSELVAVGEGGEKLGDVLVPRDRVGIATVCGVTVNGVLLKQGVPVESKFGGILEIRQTKPFRFTALINYSGTSLDPSEQFIRAHMTTVTEAARTGNGRILANFREIPAPAKSIVTEIDNDLRQAGIKGIYFLGSISEPTCQISVGLNHVGMILVGGLNPVAAAVEAGFEIDNFAESGLIDFSKLTSVLKL
jgi:repressor of nif and glnA expression